MQSCNPLASNYLPPVAKYEHALSVLRDIQLAGFDGIIAGGSARDTYLGRVPKDYDIVMFGDNSGQELVEYLTEEHTVRVYGRDCGEYTIDAGDPPSHLDWVIKVTVGGTEIDIIQQSAHPNTPAEVCEAFDVTLNMAWFGADGRVQLHENFPKPGDVIKVLRLCDVPAKRIPYLAAKFPEYQWPVIDQEGS